MTVRIGICSTAHLHADSYAASLTELSNAEFVGVTDVGDYVDDTLAKADEYGVDYLEPDELFTKVDGVIVCSTNADHATWVTRAADAGVDVLCEKPSPRLLPKHKKWSISAGNQISTLVSRCRFAFANQSETRKLHWKTAYLGSYNSLAGQIAGRCPVDGSSTATHPAVAQ
ncbi:Gfo/Idh/MocA family oxidoreductase [Haladaptatus pallidirubidus]|uniref:Gfo/Idh/MocA family oxidoreductase n=1 Tax=Haladaptatus pallidirubidus TaxID=1008152 RepID=UPI0035EB39F1